MTEGTAYPNGAEFAFAILDDTDDTTVSNGRPVYDLISSLGIKATKTVWAIDTPLEDQGPYFAGETLSSPKYLEWVHELSAAGHEIAFHNATMGSSRRDDTIAALNFLESEFNQRIRLHCNHGQNLENLHWGAKRYSSKLIRMILGARAMVRADIDYLGDDPNSEYFWADIADARIQYIRALTFRKLNGASLVPGRPYAIRSKQENSVFFNTADAPDVWSFNQIVNRRAIDQLRKARGWTIVSTHFGKGFYRDGALNEQFVQTMNYLSSLPAWFVPVSDLLDYLRDKFGASQLSLVENTKMEYSHILDRACGRLFMRSPY